MLTFDRPPHRATSVSGRTWSHAAWLPALAWLAAGCGSSGAGASGGGTSPLPLPQVVDQGGALLAAPAVVTVTFPGDPMAAELESFDQSTASSSWWDTVRAGYCATGGAPCVGDGPAGTSVELTTPPAAEYTDSVQGGPSSLRGWLSSAIAAGVLPPPGSGPTPNTIYALYFPASTTVDLDGVTSCADEGFDGYHDWIVVGTQTVAYAVIMECDPLPPPFPGAPTTTLLANTTITASHEIFETASDPVPPGPSSSGGFLLDNDVDNWGWIDVTGGGEAADMCVDFFGLNQDQTADGVFTAQRIWSNGQANSRVDPCNPSIAGGAYFNAAPEGTAFFVVAVGETATFEVDAFSYAMAGSWTLTAQDWTISTTPYLSFAFSGAASTATSPPQLTVQNGSKVQVTATLLRDPAPLETGEADGAILSFAGDPNRPTAAHFWPIAVMSPGAAQAAGVSTGLARRMPSARDVHHRAPHRAVTSTDTRNP